MSEREILFRGKIIELCKYQEQWLEGFFGSDNGKTFIAIQNENGLNGYFCDSKTVGQYTGLKDKNGTRIFEGDCFKTYCTGLPVYIHIVRYYPEHFAFMARCIERNTVHYLSDYSPSVIEVIGNIHDNPELLERRKK